MKKKMLLTKVLILIFALMMVQSIPLTVGASLDEMPEDIEKEQALTEINNSTDMDIFILGDLSSNLPSSFKFKKATAVEEVKSSKKYKSLWVTESLHNKLLTNKGLIDNYLEQGYSVYFLGLDDLNILNSMFNSQKGFEEVKEGSTQQKATFITKNKAGEYFIGHIFADKDKKYTDKSLIDTILASTWNRKNDMNNTKQQKTAYFEKVLQNKVEASGNAFSVGSDWKNVWAWQQYILNSDYGDYTEWKAGFYLTQPIDGNNYYALAIEGGMDPNYSGYGAVSSDLLEYISDADSNGQANLLKSYEPRSKPSSNTWTFTLGGAYSKNDGPSGDISATWNITLNDLTYTDKSAPSSQKAYLYFDYDRFTSYSENTSWQNASVIYQTPDNDTYSKLDNYRKATFVWADNTGGATDSASSYLVTTVYK